MMFEPPPLKVFVKWGNVLLFSNDLFGKKCPMKRVSCAKYNKQNFVQKLRSRNFGGTYSSCNSAVAPDVMYFSVNLPDFYPFIKLFQRKLHETSSNMFEEICFLVMLGKFVVNFFNAMINAMYILPGCFSKLWRLEQQLLDV